METMKAKTVSQGAPASSGEIGVTTSGIVVGTMARAGSLQSSGIRPPQPRLECRPRCNDTTLVTSLPGEWTPASTREGTAARHLTNRGVPAARSRGHGRRRPASASKRSSQEQRGDPRSRREIRASQSVGSEGRGPARCGGQSTRSGLADVLADSDRSSERQPNPRPSLYPPPERKRVQVELCSMARSSSAFVIFERPRMRRQRASS